MDCNVHSSSVSVTQPHSHTHTWENLAAHIFRVVESIVVVLVVVVIVFAGIAKQCSRQMKPSRCLCVRECELIGNVFSLFLLARETFRPSDPPEIVKRPDNLSVRVGGVASFFCSARGDPQPTIVWRKNGKKVPGTQSRYSVNELNGVSILRIEPVRGGRDDAPYECVAENGVGDAVSAEATLTVHEGECVGPDCYIGKSGRGWVRGAVAYGVVFVHGIMYNHIRRKLISI